VNSSKPRDERRAREIARTRQDILAAAGRAFGRHGYYAATMQEIAHEAGFTAASLYTYFKSKEAIHAALCEDVKMRLLATYDEPAPAGLRFAQRLELLLQRQLAMVVEHLDALRVLFDVGPPREQERDAHTAFIARTTRFFAEEGRRELRVPPREAAYLLLGLTHAHFQSWLYGDQVPDPRNLAARLVDVFLRGAGRSEHP